MHSQVRKKLDFFGFSHPLPFGAIQIVSAILDDLITTTESLKLAKEQNNKLEEASEINFGDRRQLYSKYI